LVSTLPAYLNALTKKGVFIVTVNDYLAKRDSEWMGSIHKFLGLTVGLIQSGMNPNDKKVAYEADIVYGTNNEFGFDYLRDNMATELSQCVQRNLHYAIIDEVDSILIDEARTPLIISGVVEEDTEKYRKASLIAKKLKVEEHFTVEEKQKNIILTEEGITQTEKLLNIEYLYDIEHMDQAHMLIQSLKAIHLFKRDVDYVIQNGEIIIVDEFTGRLMQGRRYSDGLHQAIEAVEGLTIQQESQTLASITFQNYFRMFKKLSGMTGTAMTEATEFEKIYGLETLEIPTNKPLVRKDAPDAVYKSRNGKYNAAVKEIIEHHKNNRPVLVGTISITTSELISELLKKKGIKHSVLNAKFHEQEAEIIANAGQPGSVTIATNMAGRGTDIVLGEGVIGKEGLVVFGTERHESRRIDNQLRGRCGRQGDPGLTKFFVSMEDDLMRLFGSDKIINIMESLGFDDTTPIEHNMISKSIERAQKKVELYHFNIRKQLLEYDDVMNKQREIIYKQRRLILEQEGLINKCFEIMEYHIKAMVNAFFPVNANLKEVDWKELKKELSVLLPINFTNMEQKNQEETINNLLKQNQTFFNNFIAQINKDDLLSIMKIIYIHSLDTKWIEHLKNMDFLREGIGLRAYAQKDPLLEYKKEGYEMFQEMMDSVEQEVITNLFKVKIVTEEEMGKIMAEEQKRIKITSYDRDTNNQQKINKPITNKDTKPGRNEPCPCGSGKKYKVCCGKQI
ncbi:MAG: preprotein translocase subunit SecA, partial [Candidatus Margulisbacteria bacterium]|nr:preprotein translocase subunit SecA [Candidatus Margulisiibacteriota bacterium]